MSHARFTIAATLALALTSTALGAQWRPYSDPRTGVSIELPAEFAPAPVQNGVALRLVDPAGDATIEVFGGNNSDDLSPRAFAEQVAGADRIAEVTYRAGGRTWFVMSGYYRRGADETSDVIFYAKFMFSPDLTRLTAFEINYPANRKREFDPIVSHMQKTLRSPR
jgi:hypothetical protein